MNIKALKFALFAVGALLLAAPFSQAAMPDRSLVIRKTVDPVFPLAQLDKQKRGFVRVVLSVNQEGKLTEHLIVAYSRKAFAKAVEDVLGDWEFEPAMLNGQPVSVITEVNIEFETGGVVVNTDFFEIVSNFLTPWRGEKWEYEPATLKQIDRIPEPVKVIAPIYSASQGKAGIKGDVTISFYINEKGQVCMPSVAKADHMVLADLAVEALRQWQFAPPTMNGDPVLVKASQTFKFEPSLATAKAAATP